MNVSPNELRKETVRTLTAAKTIMDELTDAPGEFTERQLSIYASLLQTKSTCLLTLTQLNEKR